MEFQKYNVKEKEKEKKERKNEQTKTNKVTKIIKNIYMKFAEEEKNRVFFLQSNRL